MLLEARGKGTREGDRPEQVSRWAPGHQGRLRNEAEWLGGERMGRETKAGLRRNWNVRDSQ